MPNDESKKRWRVRSWTTKDLMSRGGDAEAERLEFVLNKLADENYDVYEVDIDRALIVARLDEDMLGGGPRPQSLGSVIAGIMGARPVAPQPASESTPTEPEEASYQPQGIMTGRLLNGIHAVSMVMGLGDPTGEHRLNKMIQDLFKEAPRDEVEKTLNDVVFFHDRHRKTQCDDDSCLTNTLLVKAQEKLKAHLEANPAN